MSRNAQILQSGILLFTLTLITRLLSAGKTILVADNFGMTGMTDAYFIALVIPNTLMYMTGINTLTGMASSIFSRNVENNEHEELSITFSTIFNAALIMTTILTAVGIAFMPQIVRWYVPDFTGETYDLTVKMGRIVITIFISLGLAAYLGATLNAFRRYFLPGLGLMIANVCMILSLVFFADSLGITCIAWGTAAGNVAYFLILLWTVLRYKIKYRPVLRLRYPPVKMFLKKCLPILFLMLFSQLAVVIDRKIATEQFEGAVTGVSYALLIWQVSVSLFIMPLMTVFLPEFARDSGEKTMDALKKRIKFGSEVLFCIVLFWSFFVLIFNREIISALFQRGAFNPEDTIVTSRLLTIYMTGLVFHAGQLFFVHILLGMQKTRAIAAIGITSYSINIALIYIFSGIYGVYGLPLATASTSLLYSLLLLVTFKYRYMRFSLLRNGKNLFKIAVSGVLIAFMFGKAYSMYFEGKESDLIPDIMRLAGIFTTGAVSYAFLLQLTGVFPIIEYVRKAIDRFHG